MHEVRPDCFDSVVPGPCDPAYGCPDPTEIACIEVTKIYDFCFQQERRENVCLYLPHVCAAARITDKVDCDVLNVACRELSRKPDANNSGYADVTLLVTVALEFKILRDGTLVCRFEDSFSFMKTVRLYAPRGTEVACKTVGSRCGPAAVVNGQVCCSVEICLVVESRACVKLLVPSYGYCTPMSSCASPDSSSCPPQDLFPPRPEPAL